MYRALVAHANYLAQDRPDIQFATQELCREMIAPTVRGWNGLKRLARYLLGNPRYVQEFRRQGSHPKLIAWVDTDYAGCNRTRRSTSGGIVVNVIHVVKSWSSTQKIVALSTGEAEYYGMVKGATMGIGVKSLMGDMGIVRNKINLKVHTDSSTAKSIANRKGTGKVRHIEVCQLWVHQEVANQRMEIVKVKGINNIADILTNHIDNSTLNRHLEHIYSERRKDRHHLNPHTAKDE